MIELIQLKEGLTFKLLDAFKVRVVENHRGYVDFDEIRLVYDFDAQKFVGWYKP